MENRGFLRDARRDGQPGVVAKVKRSVGTEQSWRKRELDPRRLVFGSLPEILSSTLSGPLSPPRFLAASIRVHLSRGPPFSSQPWLHPFRRFCPPPRGTINFPALNPGRGATASPTTATERFRHSPCVHTRRAEVHPLVPTSRVLFTGLTTYL